MSDIEHEIEGPGPKVQEKVVYKPKRGGNKRGADRRFSLKSKQYEENMHRKMEGEEIPKTRRVSSAKTMTFD